MMLKVYRSLKYTFKAYCSIVNNILSEIQDELFYLSEYQKYWNAYTASIYQIDQAFAEFSSLFNEIYIAKTNDSLPGPRFSIMRLMVS